MTEGLELVEPGLVDSNEWRPDGREEEQSSLWIEFRGEGPSERLQRLLVGAPGRRW